MRNTKNPVDSRDVLIPYIKVKCVLQKEAKSKIPNPLCAVTPVEVLLGVRAPSAPAQLLHIWRCSMHGLCVCELRPQQGAAQPLPVLLALLGELTPIYLSWFSLCALTDVSISVFPLLLCLYLFISATNCGCCAVPARY